MQINILTGKLWLRLRRSCCEPVFSSGCGRTISRALRILTPLVLLCAGISALGQPAPAPRTIKVVMDDNYPPYVFKNDRGKLQGIVIDQWRLWEQKTGVKVEIHAMDWDEALRRMRAGEFDVIDTIFKTDERTNYFDFTKPYARIEVSIFFRSTISGIKNLASLKSFPVAAKDGDADVDLLKASGVRPLLLFSNYEAIITAAKEGKVNVFVVDEPPALYFLNKLDIAKDFRVTAPISSGEFHRAVRKGNTNLLQQIERGFADVGQSRLARVEENWRGRSITSSRYLRDTGWITLGMALLAMLLVIWNWTLARQVRKRTLTLQESEARLRESDERLRSVLDGMFAFVGLLSADGILQDCNRAPLAAIGKRKEEIVGRPFADGAWFSHSKETQAQVRLMIRQAASGSEVREDIQVRIATGEVLDFDASFCGLRDASGRITQIVTSGVDVTKRKSAENSLRQQEQLLRSVTDNIPRAYLSVIHKDMTVGFTSGGEFKQQRIAPAQFVGKTVEEVFTLFGQDICDEVLRNYRETFGGKERTFELRMGDEFHEYRTVPLAEPDGGINRILVFVENITGQREANERIRRLNRTYAVMRDINQLIVRKLDSQAVLDGACRIATDKGRFLLAWVGMVGPISDQLRIAAHSGASDETVKIIESLLTDPTPDCWPTRRALHTGVHQFCNDIEHDPEAATWREPALQRGYRAMIALPLVIAGRRIGTFNLYAAEPHFFDPDELRLLDELAQDIAFALESYERENERLLALDQKRISEERFRELAETVEEVFWITEPDKLKMLYISPAYEKVWGRSCQSLYDEPYSWIEAIHPDDRKRVLHVARTQQAEGKYHEEYRIIRPDGTMRWIRDRAFPVHNAAGQVERVIGVARDITEPKATEEQLRQSQKMEAIGQLAGGVAHDFNNILAAILMQADITIMSGKITPDAREGLQQIKAAAERAANLTRQLLLFSRKQVMQSAELDLNEVVTSLAKMLQRIIGEDIRLQLNLHPSPLMTRADSGMLDQILMNLAVNARDAMPQGGRLNIETSMKTVDETLAQSHPDATPGRFVWLSVSDTGAGIPPEILPRIFEPFFTTKEPGKGTGLGLATIFGIVKQHGGWIKACSEPGKGTNFQVFLPATINSLSDSSTVTPPLKPRGGTETILLVEDDTAVRFSTRLTLERHGYHVVEATNGPEALERWINCENTAALLLTDLVMPGGITGQQLARQLQTHRPSLKVIYTSGYSGDIAARELELRLGENFIQKPASAIQLLETVRRCLDGG